MLPEIPGVKSAVFTQRICAHNETFSPIGKKMRISFAILWHQGIAGSNEEDIVSAFDNFFADGLSRKAWNSTMSEIYGYNVSFEVLQN